jgi:hypothetical protein
MSKHNLDAEPSESDMRSKKLRAEDSYQTANPSNTTSVEVDREPSNLNADPGSEDIHTGSSLGKAISRSQDTKENVNSRMSLDKLPSELLREIYLNLDAPAMLSFKLVSKTLYKTTLDSNGVEVVNILEKARTTEVVYRLYLEMRLIEAFIPEEIVLERLTCGHCYRTMGRAPPFHEGMTEEELNQNGFPDECFERTDIYRMCLECIEAGEEGRNGRHEEYHIHGMRYSRCQSRNCQQGNPFEGGSDRLTRKVIQHFFEHPDEPNESSAGYEHTFIPSKICSDCFFMETRRALVKYMNTAMQ